MAGDPGDAARRLAVVVRVRWNEAGAIGCALDAGAEAVIVPMVNTPEEAAAVVHAVRYPPLGVRSYGPVAAGSAHVRLRRPRQRAHRHDPDDRDGAALERLDDILAVDGIDAIYVGPADLSLSLGLPPGNNDGRAAFDDALSAIVAACRRHGIVPGIHATGALTPRRLEQGFRMVTVTSDLVALRADGRGTGRGTGRSTPGPRGGDICTER